MQQLLLWVLGRTLNCYIYLQHDTVSHLPNNLLECAKGRFPILFSVFTRCVSPKSLKYAAAAAAATVTVP